MFQRKGEGLMKIRKLICLSICIVTLIASIFMRFSIQNTYNEVANREELLVPYISEDNSGIVSNFLYKRLLNSPIIIVGTATGNSQYVFRNFWQEVVVSNVIKGEGMIAENTTIKVTGSGKINFMYDENIPDKEKAGRTNVNTGFLNYMQKGDQYLIFISKKVNISSERVYEVNKEAMTMRYINLTKNQDQVCNIEDTEDEGHEVVYKKVKDAEFVTNSETALKKFNHIKQKLIDELL